MAQPRLATPRGPISDLLCRRLRGRPGAIVLPGDMHELTDEEDLQLALHVCYGLHYDGFAGVDEAWEWEPALLALRSQLEGRFLAALLVEARRLGVRPGCTMSLSDVIGTVRRVLDGPAGPSLSSFMADEGDREHLREFVIHRSIYQRKEADAHTWAIPRLRGAAKSALITLQADEYGGGEPGASHAELFARTMEALELDPAPEAYIDAVPGVTLATDNLVSFLGLHRRWRGALVGHLAAFEMTSVVPMRRYARSVRRLLEQHDAAEFYDVHVTADVRHEMIATEDLIAGLARTDPVALGDVPFGVGALMAVETRFTSHLLTSWAAAHSSLLGPSHSSPVPLRGDPLPLSA